MRHYKAQQHFNTNEMVSYKMVEIQNKTEVSQLHVATLL